MMAGSRIVRTVWMGCIAVALALAAPPLTTIQDTLYRADGSLFNGVLFIEWKSFEASDTSYVAMHSLTARVVNGALSVQLVPTTDATPSGYYHVRYNSDGRIQFEETWAVPPSTMPLRLKDVRVAAGSGGGGITPPPETQIQESDVVGLVNDLAQRPVKSAGYAPSRAAAIDATGALEAVVGNLDDCVHVDGTAGPCGSAGGASPAFVDAEVPAGSVDGSNAVFTLPDAPDPAASLLLYRNGLLQKSGLDYTLSANTITFTAPAIPQSGDVLSASYRFAGAGGIGGEIFDLGPGVVSDYNVADAAGIRESKLLLNYPTHTNANDPAANEKAALAGTSGPPSAANKYVTDQDPRMSDARPAAPHGLLSAAHADTLGAAPSRGDLVVGQGTMPAQWTRLALGPAGRCLTSNGFDVAWNTCLYTGFTAGAVPYVDASGSLAQSAGRLAWDNANRRLSVGTSGGTATLYVYDSQAGTGSTAVTVRAGPGQGSEPLQTWAGANGAELARVGADGQFAAAAFRGATSEARAAWQDAGSASDPVSRSDGDEWFNTSAQAHRAVHQGQTHATPQVICGSTGAATSSTSAVRLGSCTLPGNLLTPGDRVEVRFDFAHTGTAQFSIEVRWGATSLAARTAPPSEVLLTGRGDAAAYSGGAQWSAQSWGTSLALAASAGEATDSLATPLTLEFLAAAGSASDVVALRNFTVVRYPAQVNP